MKTRTMTTKWATTWASKCCLLMIDLKIVPQAKENIVFFRIVAGGDINPCQRIYFINFIRVTINVFSQKSYKNQLEQAVIIVLVDIVVLEPPGNLFIGGVVVSLVSDFTGEEVFRVRAVST